MKKIVALFICLSLFYFKTLIAQDVTKYVKGCPKFASKDYILWNEEIALPNPIDFNIRYRDCYNCEAKGSDEIAACTPHMMIQPEFKCPECLNIMRLESVYNPLTEKYENIYRIKFEADGYGLRTFYTYSVEIVPIYAVGPDGKREIVGYRYVWNPIPKLTAVEIDENAKKENEL